MASHATHIRRIYGRPWRNGSLANPGKIPTCIQVSVRPETTGTLETMLEPCPQLPAGRAGLAAVGRIDIHDGDPHGTGLVLDKALQLPECPAVQSCAHAPACPKADRKSTRLNSSHSQISYAVFCLKKKKNTIKSTSIHQNTHRSITCTT